MTRYIKTEGGDEKFPLSQVRGFGVFLSEHHKTYDDTEPWQVFFEVAGDEGRHLIFGGSDSAALRFLQLIIEAFNGDVQVIDPLDYREEAFRVYHDEGHQMRGVFV